MCFQFWGRRRPLFSRTSYGLIRAAEGKVALLMVCVKRKPLHLVFYAQLEESRTIIPGIYLCRIAGRRMGRRFERDSNAAGAKRWGSAARFAPVRIWVQ